MTNTNNTTRILENKGTRIMDSNNNCIGHNSMQEFIFDCSNCLWDTYDDSNRIVLRDELLMTIVREHKPGVLIVRAEEGQEWLAHDYLLEGKLELVVNNCLELSDDEHVVYVYPDQEVYDEMPSWKSDDCEVRVTKYCHVCDELMEPIYGTDVLRCECCTDDEVPTNEENTMITDTNTSERLINNQDMRLIMALCLEAITEGMDWLEDTPKETYFRSVRNWLDAEPRTYLELMGKLESDLDAGMGHVDATTDGVTETLMSLIYNVASARLEEDEESGDDGGLFEAYKAAYELMFPFLVVSR